MSTGQPLHQGALKKFMTALERRNPGETEFQQAVQEVMADILPFAMDTGRYATDALLERLTEPNRIIVFRVTWEDDHGQVRAHRGRRVQFNNAIGPYKGGCGFTWT